MISRRAFLGSAAASAVVGVLPIPASAGPALHYERLQPWEWYAALPAHHGQICRVLTTRWHKDDLRTVLGIR